MKSVLKGSLLGLTTIGLLQNASLVAGQEKPENGKSPEKKVVMQFGLGSYQGQLQKHTAELRYHTEMDTKGELTMHFDLRVLGFLKPSFEENNVRICFGMREKVNTAEDTNFFYENEDMYDIVQLSMKRFKVPAEQWSIKDGMTSDLAGAG